MEKAIKITFLPVNTSVSATAGETLLDIALQNDIPLQHACGGYCACTTCQVMVRSETSGSSFSPMESDEEDRLEKNDLLKPGSRLACQTKVFEDVVVEIQNLEN